MLMVPTSPAIPQGQILEVIQQPVRAQQLSGYVRIPSDSRGLAGVLIAEYDADRKQVLTAVTTDENGYFHLDPATKGSIHFLRLSAPNYNPRLYTVKLSKHAPAELDLRLNPGT
jgi:hypothetical protein